MFGLFVWDVVTFVAVRLAIISAGRATASTAARPMVGV
jgi:hypothetical protein